MKRIGIIFFVLMAALAGLGWLGERDCGPVVVNHEGEAKVILRKFHLPFGSSLRVVEKPGLSLRFPALTTLVTLDQRIQHINVSDIVVDVKPPESDEFAVDCALLWRIQDPAKFYEAFGVDAISGAPDLSVVEQSIAAELRENVSSEVSRHVFADLLAGGRAAVEMAIRERSYAAAAETGVEIVAIRFTRFRESAVAREVVYERMRSYQAQLAADFREQAASDAEQIRAKADATLRRAVAEAEKQASLARASADAEAARIYAEAYEQDREFFRFLRSLAAYRKALNADTTIMLSPDNVFFEYFNSDAKRGK